MQIIKLGTTDQELRAAKLLRGSHSIRIDLPRDDPRAKSLLRAGFVTIPQYVRTCVALPFEPSGKSRNWRKSLGVSMRAWDSAGARIRLIPGADVPPKMAEDIYYGLFVRTFYARGISPFGAHNWQTFDRMLRGAILALVEASGETLGAALVAPASTAQRPLTIHGTPLQGRAVEGLIYTLRETSGPMQRAFMVHLGATLRQEGYDVLILGRDVPWIEPRYAPVLIEKMRMADELALDLGRSDILVNIPRSTMEERGLALFTVGEAGSIELTAYGELGTRTVKDLIKAQS
ncbi:MAG TPA: hypothetical protein VLH09_06680 [Bryobacteraceae bacterium]|nr:hypothetical protein [Bryobacteraceae bacterium]